AESVREVGLACCEHTCNNPMLTKFTASTLMSVPGLRGQVQDFLKALDQIQKTVNIGQKKDFAKGTIDKRSVTPGGNRKRVEGYEMQEISGALGGAPSASIPYLFLIGFLIFIALISWGFRRRTL
ncbi:MAG: hypothetical protein P3W84_000805, partial [Thermodesulfobacteriaceae bacterium]|nr:hypothetical protein [Thermodesulfobacteriaceae bacterium]